jgi:hypothetical protein
MGISQKSSIGLHNVDRAIAWMHVKTAHGLANGAMPHDTPGSCGERQSDGLKIGLGDLQPIAVGFQDRNAARASGLHNIFKQCTRAVRFANTKQQQSITGACLEPT